MRWPDRGGCDFAADPDLDARNGAVFWGIDANPGTILLTQTPEPVAMVAPVASVKPTATPPIAVSADNSRLSTEGQYVVSGKRRDGIPAVLLDGANTNAPLSALIPLDGDLPDRIAALLRFWTSLQSPPPPADPRLTAQRRSRIRNMMQASDGWTLGAHYREIAIAMFGASRVSSDVWKTSSLRDTTIRLVRDGRALIDGGYRSLLRFHRQG